jgi:hypothetical protein
LLVVGLLVVVITTMYWGYGAGSRRVQEQKACQSNLQKIHMAMEIFANDFGGSFPNVPGAQTSDEALYLLVPRYTVDTSIFICPGSKDPPLPAGESFQKRRISYAYYMGRHPTDAQEVLMSDRQVDTQAKVPGQTLFSDNGKPPGNNHGAEGGNLLFGDGRVEWSPAQTPFSLVLTQGVMLLNPKP